jgi:hypothetical protein
MRLALLVRDGEVPRSSRWMETVWADPATPTFAQKADAVVKLYQADRLVPRRMARRTLGFTGPQIADMEAEDQEAAEQAQRQSPPQPVPTPPTPTQPGAPATTGEPTQPEPAAMRPAA